MEEGITREVETSALTLKDALLGTLGGKAAREEDEEEDEIVAKRRREAGSGEAATKSF